MEKTFLEKYIQDKAQRRIEQNIRDVSGILRSTRLGNLFVKTSDDKSYRLQDIFPYVDGEFANIFDIIKKTEGFASWLKETKEKYEKEETDKLLNRLGDLEDLFVANL